MCLHEGCSRRFTGEEFDEDFADISAVGIADATAHWPPHVSATVKDLVLCASGKCLCQQSMRKRMPVAEALDTLSTLTGVDGDCHERFRCC